MSFKFSRLQAAARLSKWLGLIVHFYLAVAADALLRRNTPERQALHLWHAFEARGGAYAKLGMHLSMRVDFMPWQFSVELSRMADHLPPFPAEQAIEIVERATRMPLTAVFERFDPNPISSTSVACTYQTVFHNHEEVIVKVRRPGIGEQFMADLQAFDWLLRRDSVTRRAVRLRQALERAEGTFVKFGQQAAMRIDLLPRAYCVELSKMLEKMVPFRTEQALAAIERTTGKPWQETFAIFDPEPIGSASIACVHQATLKDGRKVAVKVRRTDIERVFLADFQVLDWLAGLAEFLTIFRPGLTRNLRAVLRETLLEELDFRREARFQDTFRRNAKESGKDFFRAPRVFFDLSSEEVLVQEFVSGMWLREVIAAVEQKGPAGRALLRQRHIDPLLVARRIMWAAFWSMDENVFFHADPHPAKILVCDNNQLTFIDFGSCGSFNNPQRMAMEQLALSMERQDVEGMTLATLSLMEPLPPVDTPAIVRMSQRDYLRVLHTFNTLAEYTEYWGCTSARQWVVLIQVARKFNLTLDLHMLRMIRTTLLYDSIVLRLDHQLSRYHEYTEFVKDREA